MSSQTDASQFENTGQWSDLVSVALLDIAICAGIVIAFQVLRTSQRLSFFYAPKAFSSFSPYENIPHNNGWITMIRATMSVSNDRLFELRGLDALMHAVFLRTMIMLFLSLMPVALIVMAVNAMGGGGLSGVLKFSISNVSDGSMRMWVHILSGYAFTLITLFWMFKGYKIFEQYSVEENSKNSAHNYTTLLRDIPNGASLEGPNVMSVHWAVKSRKLRRLMKKREGILQEQKLMRDQYQQHGEVSDGREKWVWKLRHIEEKIAALRSEEALPASHTAFVTHDSVGSAYYSVAAGMRTSSAVQVEVRPRPAPCVNDVMWASLAVPKAARAAMTALAIIITFFLLFFWGIPVAFAQAIANLDHLARLPGLSFIANVQNLGPISVSLIEGFIPPLILIGFFALLPMVIRTIHKIRAPVSFSKLDRHVTGTYYAFKAINVFLGAAFVGSFFDILKHVRQGQTNGSPLSIMTILKLLNDTIPDQSLFFITYILALTFITYPLNLLRIGEVLVSQFKMRGAKTAEEKQYRQKPSERHYSTWYGVELLVYTIAIAFAFIAPVVLPFALLFFLMASFVCKYDAVYVAVPVNQGLGKHWHTAFHCLMAGLIMAQMTAISVIAFKEFPEAAFLGLMPLITVAFCIYIHRRFHRTCDTLPDESFNTSIKGGFQFAESYVDPAIDERREDLTRDENELLDVELEKADFHSSAGSAQNLPGPEFQHVSNPTSP